MQQQATGSHILKEIPTVDWLDLEGNREKFMADLRYALSFETDPQDPASGYNPGRDRGANACVNRMGTFPQVTRRWWVEEFAELGAQQREEVEAETAAAFRFAEQRGRRFQNNR